MSLEPLFDYLHPGFGNIYDFDEVPDERGVYGQPWTPELRAAVKHYLVHEVTDEDYAAFLEELDYAVSPGSREEQAEFMVANIQAWEIAYAFHLAALKAVPRLDQLIGHLDSWPNADLQEDVGIWSDVHVSEEQLRELADMVGYPEPDPGKPWYTPMLDGRHLVEKLTPSELLRAWQQVVGPAESDLTNEEWQLLIPALPEHRIRNGSRQRTERELHALRAAFDGMRYKFTNNLPWSNIPQRYGKFSNLYQRWAHYRDADNFGRMFGTLRGNPKAGRVVTWLEEMNHSDG